MKQLFEELQNSFVFPTTIGVLEERLMVFARSMHGYISAPEFVHTKRTVAAENDRNR
jgi:hypothetical protein